MGVAVGIDLGTTNTVVSAVKDGWPVTLVDSENRRLLPSVVSFHPSGKVLVGHSAKERRIVDPTSTVFSVKRLIGRAWESPEAQRAAKALPFEIAEGEGHEVQVVARGERYTLPEISAFILRRAKAIAEAALGEPVRQAVITVPANFNDPQREATKLAGKLAGLEVLRILSEPTAAALAYGETGGKQERIAVYDLGGGTFDVTVLDVSGTVFQVLSTGGDTALGGDDIDDLIAGLMNESLLRQFRYDARTDPTARATLKARAEELKILLSANMAGEVSLGNLVRGEGGQFLPAAFQLDRTALETLASPLLERTLDTCRKTIEKAGMKVEDASRILLVGGSTRMPLVGQRVEEWFGRKVSARVNPDEVVAHGAAVQAASLARGSEVGPSSFRPRPSFSFAIDIGQGIDAPKTNDAPPSQPAAIAVPLPPKLPDNLVPQRISSLPPAAQVSSPPSATRPASVQHTVAAWPPPPPSQPTPAVEAPLVLDAPPVSVGPVSRSSRPPLSVDQEALLKAFLGAAPAASPSRRPSSPPPTSKPSSDIEDELRAFLSGGDAPPDASSAPPEGIVAAPESMQPPLARPETPALPIDVRPRPSGLPSVGPRPSPVISDSPPAAPLRAKAPPLPASRPAPAAPSLPVVAPDLPAPPPPASPTVASPARPAPPPPVRPPPVANPLLIDVTPLSLGVETVGGFCDIIIRANSPVPCERNRVFQTASDNQTSVVVKICQGESDRFAENTTLGDLRLTGFRPAPRGEVAVTVTFEIDADGILNVRAMEVGTGRSATARIELLGAQTDAKKIQAMMDRQAQREVA